MQYRNYTDEDFIEAWTTSSSIRQVLNKLGLAEAGGNYACAKKRAATLNLTKDHMLGQGWNKGKTFGPKRPLEAYLSNEFGIQSNKLRQRLISEGYKEYKCEICGIMEWNGQLAPLELDHIDGNHHNNTLDNLRVICPNCHAQTDTYRGKNKNK
tara:strand:+ start:168 stop:629 length:462 start_codon:yes stop_codon:yes gene_type:complete